MNVEDMIVQARVTLLMRKPFFGNIAMLLKPVDASKWCKTAATDGSHLFYNVDFVKKLTMEELIFLIAHEIMHCIFDHLGRRGARQPDIWNAANDYIVNHTLVKNAVGKMPSMGLYSDKYTDEMLSEEVYDLLVKDLKGKPAPKTLDEHLEPSEGEGDGEGKGKGKSKGKGETGEEGDEASEVGDGSGKNPDGDPDPGSETGVDYSSRPPVFTEDDLEAMRNKLRQAILTASQVNEGNVPACIQRLVDDFTDPKINWKELLAETISGSIRDDYTFNIPNRRSHSLGVIMPSQTLKPTIKVAVSLDTSGSISDSIFTSFLSETVGILEQYEDYELHLWCIDAAIYNYKVFTPENGDEIMDYKPAGGGGNDFPLNWKFMRENEIEPAMIVVFSDGYPCGSWGDPDYCDTIFVIKNDWDKTIRAPFGRTVYLEPDPE